MFAKIIELWKKSPLSGHGMSKIPLFKSLYKLGIRLAGKNFVNLDGHRIQFEEFFAMCISEAGGYDPEETSVIRRLVKPGFTCLDIGANAGYYALLFAKLTGPKGHVYAFEPEKNNYDMCVKNIKANGYENITAVRSAVSDVSGRVKLFLSEAGAVDHCITPDDTSRKWQETDVTTIDGYLAGKTEKVDYVKLDIQGADFKAIKGMTGILKNNPNIIIQSEFWPKGLKAAGHPPVDFLNFLKDSGFTVYDINECSSLKSWKPADFNKMLSINTPENQNFTNIIAVRDKLLNL
jgi:FkbM family methyltransferase